MRSALNRSVCDTNILKRFTIEGLCLLMLLQGYPVLALQERTAATPRTSIQRVEKKAPRAEVSTLPPAPRSVRVTPSPEPVQKRTALKNAAQKSLDPEIVQLAQSLDGPAAILRQVQDTIVYDPKFFADSSPLGTLWEGRGTAWDQAWLLQELLIAAGVDARLEWGEVEIDPDLLQTLAGVSDPLRAADLLTTAGNRVVVVLDGSRVVSARMPHVWVKAHLDFIPNRGVTHGTPDTWIRLDPTFKDHPTAEGTRYDDVTFSLADHLQSGTESTPRGVYEADLLSHAASQGGPSDLDALKPLRTLKAENFPFVPGTLRAKVLSVDGEAETVPTSKQVHLDVNVRDADAGPLLQWSTPLPAVYGQRLELRWRGATSADQATLDLYGGIFNTPPYEVDLAPGLLLDGNSLLDGGAIGSAEDVEVTATLSSPEVPGTSPEVPGTSTGSISTDTVITARWDLFAGEQAVFHLDLGHTPQQLVDRYVQGAQGASTTVDQDSFRLAAAGATYLHQLGNDLQHLADLRWHRVVPLGIAVLAVQRGAASVLPSGTPDTFSRGPQSLDLGAMPLGLFPTDGVEVPAESTAAESTAAVSTLELIGAQSSVREGEALAAVFGGEHPTAVGFLKRAVREDQNLTLVDDATVDSALGDAELGDAAEWAVRDAVDRGLVAWIAEKQIEINGWKTSGYIVEDLTTGLGGYHVTFERRLTAQAGAITFHAPQDLDVLTAPTDVIASIDIEPLQSWSLATRPVGATVSTVIATGNGPVDETVLGQFDPTLLLNGLHDLVLTATDVTGNTVSHKVTVSVEGNMKIGHFTLSFVDLAIPVSGLDIEVVRTYDSRQRLEQGDFGQGWTLDIRQGSYRNNRPPGDGWRIPDTQGPWGLPCSSVQETKSHLTTVRLSDQEVYRFRLALRNLATVVGGCYADAVFEWVDGPLPGTTLEILGDNQVFAPNGSDRVVVPDTQEPFVPEDVKLTTRDGRIFHLDLSDGVTHVEDLHGNFLEITPEGITHSSGKSVEFERDDTGRIVRITDPMGHSNHYAYDATGDLVTFTDRVDATTRFTYSVGHYLEDIENALGVRAVRTEYDAEGRMVRMIDASGKATAFDHDLENRREVITNRLGHTRVLEYDGRGNVVRETDEVGAVTVRTFDAENRLLSETDPLGQVTSSTYDAEGNLTSITDPLGHVTRLTFDSNGNPTSITDALGQVTTFDFDERGELLASTDPLGATTRFTYDAGGQVLTETDALGHVTAFAYDAFGNVIRLTDPLGSTTTITYDSNGQPTSRSRARTLADGTAETVATTFSVDALGRVTAITDPAGATTTVSYTLLGAERSTTDALGRTTQRTYDDRGQLIEVTYPDGRTESRDYDAEGRLISATDPAGRSTDFTYDPTGRLIETHYPDGASVQYAYDPAGRQILHTDANGQSSHFEYDAAGRQTRTTDPLGIATVRSYDAGGRLVAIVSGIEPGNDIGQSTTFIYDALGRQLESRLADGSGTTVEYDALGRRTAEIDAAGVRTEFAYDALGRLTQITDALGSLTRHRYDELGDRIEQIDANGHITRFEYDRLGRQTARILPDDSRESFEFDVVGRRIAHTDFNGATTTHTYDLADRLIRRTAPNGTSVEITYTPTGQRASLTDTRGTTTWTYDLRDRRMTTTTPEGWILNNTWDPTGRRTALELDLGDPENGGLGTHTTAMAYDAAGRLITVTDARGGVSTYARDPFGRPTSLRQANGSVTTYSYNPAGRLLSLETMGPDGDLIQDYTYSLGPTGNRQSVQEIDGTVRTWDYDALHRLIGEEVTDGTGGLIYEHRFTYDAVGNRLEQLRTASEGTEETITYTYDVRDRLLSETRGTAVTTYGWDANGNLTSRTDPSGTTTYGWDSEDRLIATHLPDGAVVHTNYDADGVRVGRSLQRPDEPTVETVFVTDTTGPLSQLLAEVEDGHLLAQYTHGDRLLGILHPNSHSAVHHDGLGSVRALSNNDGLATDRYTYEAFGSLLDHQGIATQPFGFAGEPFDHWMDLAYHRARWMAPRLGSFVGMDPELGRQRIPISQHRYLYAHADPLTWVDPTGRFASATELSIVSGIRTSLVGIQSDVGFVLLDSSISGDPKTSQVLFGLMSSIAIGITGLAMIQFIRGAGRGFISGRDEILKKMRVARSRKRGFQSAAGEIRAARALRSRGRNVHFRRTAADEGIQNEQTSDFFVDGQRGTGKGGLRYDVLTPQTSNRSRIATRVKKKASQAERIIVDLDGGTSLTESDFDNFLDQVNNLGGTKKIKEVILVRGGEVVRTLN